MSPSFRLFERLLNVERMLKNWQVSQGRDAMPAGRKAVRAGGEETRARIVEAAVATLRTAGFAGASARAIAAAGGFNQALIFYHFGSLDDLLLAALDATAAARLARYEAAVAKAGSLPELLKVAGRLYDEDLASGHITVVTELIGGSLTRPALRPEIRRRMQPWLDFTEAALGRTTGGGLLYRIVPGRDVAYGVIRLYLGLQMLTHLDGRPDRARALFAAGSRIGARLDTVAFWRRLTPGRS
jgi:AcrR family transcriptional regulator